MTREEAIARIKDHMIVHKMYEPRAVYISEALDMAIKALEQEPTFDDECQKDMDEAWEQAKQEEYEKAYDDYLAIVNAEQEPMREFTEEEAEAYSKALDRMYKPTGLNVFNEPCTDAVSREAVIKAITNTSGIRGDALNALYALPSVTPSRRKGRWKKIEPYPLQMHEYECSECLHETDDNTENFCSMCGAEMVEPQESEVRNESDN